jgi:hypothetical protein
MALLSFEGRHPIGKRTMSKTSRIIAGAVSIEKRIFDWNELKSDPINVAYECQAYIEEVDEKYYDRLYRLLTIVYGLGICFENLPEQWASFRSQSFFAKLKQSKPCEDDNIERIIYWVCRFMFGAVRTDGRRYNRAYKYARALQRYARQGTEWRAIAAKLMEDGGVDHAYELDAEEYETVAANDDDTDGPSDSTPIRDGQEGEGGSQAAADEPRGKSSNPAPRSGAKAKGGGDAKVEGGASAPRRGKKGPESPKGNERRGPPPAPPATVEIDPENHLVIEANPKDVHAARELDVDGEAQVTFKRVAHGGSWKRFVEIKVRIDDDHDS